MLIDYLLVLAIALLGGIALGKYKAGKEPLFTPCLILGFYLPASALSLLLSWVF